MLFLFLALYLAGVTVVFILLQFVFHDVHWADLLWRAALWPVAVVALIGFTVVDYLRR